MTQTILKKLYLIMLCFAFLGSYVAQAMAFATGAEIHLIGGKKKKKNKKKDKNKKKMSKEERVEARKKKRDEKKKKREAAKKRRAEKKAAKKKEKAAAKENNKKDDANDTSDADEGKKTKKQKAKDKLKELSGKVSDENKGKAKAAGQKAALMGGLSLATGLLSGKSVAESMKAGVNSGADSAIGDAAQHSEMAGAVLKSDAVNAARSGDFEGAANATKSAAEKNARDPNALGQLAVAAGADEEMVGQIAASDAANNGLNAVLDGNIEGAAKIGQGAAKGAIADPEKRAALAKMGAGAAGQDEDIAAEMAGSDAFGEGAGMLADGDFGGMADAAESKAKDPALKQKALGMAASKAADFIDEGDSDEEGGISDDEDAGESDSEEGSDDETPSFEEEEAAPEEELDEADPFAAEGDADEEDPFAA